MFNVSKSDFGKFRHKRFSYSREKSQKAVFVVVVFLRMTESGTFERLSVFPERANDFHDFLE